MTLRDQTLLAAVRLRLPREYLRALALGDATGVMAWIQTDAANRLSEARAEARVEGRRLAALGVRIVALPDDEYPAGLRDLLDPPPFLSIRGRLPTGGVAVVGSREPSARALAFAREFVRLVGRPLISGLARGIDAAAHEVAAALRLPQVAYIGTGITLTYPPEHDGLAEQIVTHGGAIASERRSDAAMTPWSLVRRDRLQAAHAGAVVLVESEIDGGAMHTMYAAKTLRRPRFAVDFNAEGNRRALDEGAELLSSDAAEAAQAVLLRLAS